MARVGSVGKLDASGGSAAQLLGRCLAKAVALGAVVFLTTAVSLPRIVLEAVYGALRLRFPVRHQCNYSIHPAHKPRVPNIWVCLIRLFGL